MARREVLSLLRAALKGAFIGFLAWLIGVTLFGTAALALSGTSGLIKFRATNFLPSAILLGVLLIGGEATLAFLSAWMKRPSAGPLAAGPPPDEGRGVRGDARELLAPHLPSTEARASRPSPLINTEK